MNRDLNLLNSYVKTLTEKLIAECKNQGIEIIVIGTYRSIEEQNELYAQGRTKAGNIVTNARGGYSYHNFGYAFDIAVKKGSNITWDNKEYDPVGAIGKSLGLEWGGDFKSISDSGHFQYTQGLTTADFREGKRPNVPSVEVTTPQPVVEQPKEPKTWENYITGDLAKELQSALNSVYGRNLKVDGYLGDNSMDALEGVLVVEGQKNALVRVIQKRLMQLGYNLNRYGADGAFGKGGETAKAVRQFQADRHLVVDCKVGKNSLKELFRK